MRNEKQRGRKENRQHGEGHRQNKLHPQHPHGAKTFRRARAIAFFERMNLRRQALKKQLETPELQSIYPVLVGELKALDMVIQEFYQLFELYEYDLETIEKTETKTNEEGANMFESINRYIDTVFYRPDEHLENTLLSIEENGMRSISVSPSTGKLLSLLVTMSGAKNILEIGALGGYSGICLAKGFGKDGILTSLELEESYAQLAHSNLAKAGYGDQVTYMIGPALESLVQLVEQNRTFDFFFIDADKENYENYLNECIKLAEDGAWIVCDNVLARGSVADENSEPKRHTAFMRTFNETVAKHPQLESVLIPLGDGLTVSRVKK